MICDARCCNRVSPRATVRTNVSGLQFTSSLSEFSKLHLHCPFRFVASPGLVLDVASGTDVSILLCC